MLDEVAEPGAAPFLFDRDAVQPKLAELGPEVAREGVAAVDLVGARCDPVGGKAAHAFPRKDSMPYFLGRGPPRQSSFSADVLLRLSPDRRHPIWLVGSSSDESG